MPSQKRRGTHRERHAAVEQRLIDAHKAKSLEEAVERAAARLLGEYTIPINLAPLARKLNARVVVLSQSVALGETHRLTEHNEIRIRAEDQGQQRQRFTVAHEYAHILLDQLGTFRSTVTLEQLCDRIASAILLPRPDVAGRIRRRTADEVIQIARDFKVSLQAAAVRFAQLTGCAVFRVIETAEVVRVQEALPFTQRRIPQRSKIVRLAGPLQLADVRGTLMDDEHPSLVVLARGTALEEWVADEARTHNGDRLVLFKRRH